MPTHRKWEKVMENAGKQLTIPVNMVKYSGIQKSNTEKKQFYASAEREGTVRALRKARCGPLPCGPG